MGRVRYRGRVCDTYWKAWVVIFQAREVSAPEEPRAVNRGAKGVRVGKDEASNLWRGREDGGTGAEAKGKELRRERSVDDRSRQESRDGVDYCRSMEEAGRCTFCVKMC